MSAQRKSLRSLERLRLFHAVSVFVVTAGVLAWAVMLWRAGSNDWRRRADDHARHYVARLLARSRHGDGRPAGTFAKLGEAVKGSGCPMR